MQKGRDINKSEYVGAPPNAWLYLDLIFTLVVFVKIGECHACTFLRSVDLISFVAPRIFIFIYAPEFRAAEGRAASYSRRFYSREPALVFIHPDMQIRERGVPRNIDGPRVINIFRDLNHKLDLQTNLPANSCFRDGNSSRLARRMWLPYISRNVVAGIIAR